MDKHYHIQRRIQTLNLALQTQLMLQEAINSLPDKQKAVFNMKYFEEMKYEEMSQITGTSIGALKASFHLAVKKIEEYFNNRD